MLITAQTLPEKHEIAADICIIGGGIAGLTLATSLRKQGLWKVAILEGGGIEADPAAQALYEAAPGSDHYQEPTLTRQRQLGGTAQIWNTLVAGEWGAKYLPLDPMDFEERPWVPYSGWPITLESLRSYLEKAQEVCGLGPLEYGAAYWESPEARPWKLKSNRVQSAVYQLGGGEVFRTGLRKALEESDQIACYIGANVVELVPDGAGARIASVKIATMAGKRLTARARVFVLATGGIENARLLLASNKVWSAGVGNQNDLVGRFLMDHPILSSFASLVPLQNELIATSRFYDFHDVRGTQVLGRLAVSPETQAAEKILNGSLVLLPKLRGYRSKGVEALRQLRFMARGKRSRRGALGQAARFIGHFPDLLAYRRLERMHPNAEEHYWSARDTSIFATFEPQLYLEQVPDPENRVTLAEERDTLEMPKVRFRWRWGKQDEQSAQRTHQILAQEIEAAGIGRLEPLAAARLDPSGHHHLGTTRMSIDPKRGVVDTNCRVHGVDNLYLAGSSVFPVCGFANPTLLLVALALRLGETIRASGTITLESK